MSVKHAVLSVISLRSALRDSFVGAFIRISAYLFPSASTPILCRVLCGVVVERAISRLELSVVIFARGSVLPEASCQSVHSNYCDSEFAEVTEDEVLFA